MKEKKEILRENFIMGLEGKKGAKIHDSVFFFGPSNVGKTFFAQAFAQETGCKIVPIRISPQLKERVQKEESFWGKLTKEAEKAKGRFEKEGIRTILFTDEIDRVASIGTTIKKELEGFLENCSEKFHCIVFAANNYPRKIGLNMNKIFPVRVALDPAGEKNLEAMFRHYIADKTTNKFNHTTLAREVLKNSKDGMFSNSQIKNIVQDAHAAKKEQMTQEDVLHFIKVDSSGKKREPSIKRIATEIEGEKKEYDLRDYEEDLKILTSNHE